MEKGKRGNKEKSRKKVLAAVACISFVTAAGGFFFWQKGNADASEGVVVIAAGENEKIIYAQIDSIVGNDIDVSVMKENMQAEAETQVKDTQEAAENNTGGGSGASPEKTEGDMPEEMLEDTTEEMPRGMLGDMPEGIPQGIAGDMPDGFPGNRNGSMSGGVKGSRNSAGNISAYTETGEARSFEIPVGTQVITKLGVETTFSRLSAGNIIALLLEKGTDNILKIWVVS